MLDAFPAQGFLPVIIHTPQGSRNQHMGVRHWISGYNLETNKKLKHDSHIIEPEIKVEKST